MKTPIRKFKRKLSKVVHSIPVFLHYQFEATQNSRNAVLHSDASPIFFIKKKYILNETEPIQFDKAIENANAVLQHSFNFLGCNEKRLDKNIYWNKDYLSGHSWENKFYLLIMPIDPLDDPIKAKIYYDGKLPYELNRFQHLGCLLQAYSLAHKKEYSNEVIHQISNWIKNNRFLYGVNWTCAMEVAIRACNWMWAWWALHETPSWTNEFNERFIESIWQHGWYIEHNLEDKGGIRTNHYLSDIVGLLFIGVMFSQLKDAERWQKFGVQELIRSMEEMVYPDGVSFENSIAYHRLVMELFTYSAILCKRNEIALPAPFWQRLEKMFEFIMDCMRPDGRMPMIGDADDGRFFILADYYDWDRWDFRYLLSIGAVLFERSDFKLFAGKMHEEVLWLFGEDGVEQYEQL